MHSLFSLLHPNLLVETVHSKFSGDIQVRTEFGRPRLWAGGIPQSGGIVTDILKKALDEFDQPKNFLLLGLGGGDILWQIHKRWPASPDGSSPHASLAESRRVEAGQGGPNCHITAVEIDPLMVNLAKKYFKINQIPNLKVITADASKFMQKANSHQLTAKFDAILIDCYLGTQIPPQLETPTFLKNLKKILAPSGIITFNRLYAKPSQPQTQNFIKTLKTIFPSVSTKPAYCNLIVIAKNTSQTP